MSSLPTPRRALALAALLPLSLALAGCATSANNAPAAAAPAASTPQLPPSAAPAPELANLAFLTGRWVTVNPNGTVNDEHWLPPRGNSMAGLFRQIRRDGRPALVEVSLITAEPDGVRLRLRHLHAQLDVPANRPNVSLFRLVSAADNRAEFAGTGDAEQVRSVVYRLDGPDTLVQEVTFAPESRESGYSLRYTRER